MTHACNRNIPVPVESEYCFDMIDQFHNMIADTFFAESSEAGQILANLFRRHADAASELFRRNDIRTLRPELPEGSEI